MKRLKRVEPDQTDLVDISETVATHFVFVDLVDAEHWVNGVTLAVLNEIKF